MINALRSEFFLLRKRRVVYIMGLLWVLMVTMFAFGIPYIVAISLPEQDAAALLEIVSLSMYPQTSLSSYPMFGAATFLILGAVIGGSDWGWGTWKALLTHGPSRWQVVLAKAVVAASAAAVIAVVAQVTAFPVSYAMSSAANLGTTLPAWGAIAGSFGSAVLIAVASCSVGLALAIVTKNLSLSLAAGLLWVLAFENIVSGLVQLWRPLAFVQKILLGPASGSLAAALGATELSKGGTPGVVAAMSVPAAITVLIAYTVIAASVSGLVMNRRDIS